jgi:MFS family permease
MIYLASKGFSLIQLGLLESTFHITSFLMEIPTGAVADIWGKKTSRTMGRFFYLLSLLVLFLSPGFTFQLLGFIICALGYNLESGAGEALLYDSLKVKDKDDLYMAIAGKKEFISQFSSIIALLIGGFIATGNYNLVFLLSLVVVLFSIITSFTFIEPDSDKARKRDGNILKLIRTQTLNSLRVVNEKRQIAFLIIFSQLIFSFTVSLFFYLQNYWKSIGYSEFTIGIIFAASSLLSGLTGLSAHKIEKLIGGEKGIIKIVPLFMIIAFWGISLTEYKNLFYLLIGLMDGLLYVAVSDYINRLIPSEYRATVLSFQSMVFSFFMIIIFPSIGWIGDHYGLNRAFLIITIVASLISCLYFIFRNVKEEQKAPV